MWNTVSVFTKRFAGLEKSRTERNHSQFMAEEKESGSLLQTHICTFNDARLAALMRVKSVCSDHRRISRRQIHFWFIYSYEGGLIPIWQNPNTCPLFFFSPLLTRSCYNSDLCHSRREQNRTGSLEPCAVNPACVLKNKPRWNHVGINRNSLLKEAD